MKRSTRLGSILALCCCGVSAATISIEPSSGTFGVVAIDVNVAGATDLFGFQFDVGFTPSALAVKSVSEGALFSGRGSIFTPGLIDRAAGTIRFIADSLTGPGPGISADGTLARIVFGAIESGTGSVQISNVVLLDSSLAEIPATVNGAATFTLTPEPGTFGTFLVASGLMALVVHRRRRRVGMM